MEFSDTIEERLLAEDCHEEKCPDDETSNASAQKEPKFPDETSNASVQKEQLIRPYNPALFRWTLHRVNKNTISIADIKQEKIWSPVTFLIVVVFLVLFYFGFLRLGELYRQTPYSMYGFHVVCCIVYVVTYIRGIYIFTTPIVFYIVSTYLRIIGYSQNILYDETSSEIDNSDILKV